MTKTIKQIREALNKQNTIATYNNTILALKERIEATTDASSLSALLNEMQAKEQNKNGREASHDQAHLSAFDDLAIHCYHFLRLQSIEPSTNLLKAWHTLVDRVFSQEETTLQDVFVTGMSTPIVPANRARLLQNGTNAFFWLMASLRIAQTNTNFVSLIELWEKLIDHIQPEALHTGMSHAIAFRYGDFIEAGQNAFDLLDSSIRHALRSHDPSKYNALINLQKKLQQKLSPPSAQSSQGDISTANASWLAHDIQWAIAGEEPWQDVLNDFLSQWDELANTLGTPELLKQMNTLIAPIAPSSHDKSNAFYFLLASMQKAPNIVEEKLTTLARQMGDEDWDTRLTQDTPEEQADKEKQLKNLIDKTSNLTQNSENSAPYYLPLILYALCNPSLSVVYSRNKRPEKNDTTFRQNLVQALLHYLPLGTLKTRCDKNTLLGQIIDANRLGTSAARKLLEEALSNKAPMLLQEIKPQPTGNFDPPAAESSSLSGPQASNSRGASASGSILSRSAHFWTQAQNHDAQPQVTPACGPH